MRLRMRKASQQPNPNVANRPSRTKRRHSEVEEDTPTSGGRGIFSTIKKFIRGNAVKVQLSAGLCWWCCVWIEGFKYYYTETRATHSSLSLRMWKSPIWHVLFSYFPGPSSVSWCSVMFPKKCLEECSRLSDNLDLGLILTFGSQSWCAGTGGTKKRKSQLS